MSSRVATDFFNSKRRVIYVTDRGAYMSGTSTYNPKAKFFRNPGGAVVSTRYANLTTIPQKIRPKIDRKTRSNVGMARGKYAARVGGVAVRHVKRKAYIGAMMEGYVKAPRKVRSNKGTKRGPRKPRVSPARNQLAVKLQRYLNGNTANKSILSTANLASINRAAKLLKIVAGTGQGWRFTKGSSAGSYKNVSNGSPRRMTRSNVLQAIHNYGQGSNNRNINKYVSEFRAPTPSHLWM
jgi:hypothetical protein